MAMLGLLCSGCMAHVRLTGEYVVPRSCMKTVELTESTECRYKPGEKMNCTGIELTKIKGCEHLEVERHKK